MVMTVGMDPTRRLPKMSKRLHRLVGRPGMLLKTLCLLVLAQTIAGCNYPDRSTFPTDQFTLEDTGTPLALGEQTAIPTATPQRLSESCPIPLGVPDLPALNSPSNWPSEILAYLNQGGSVSSLIESIPTPAPDGGLSAAVDDLNSDGSEDLIIRLSQALQSDDGMPPDQSLMIFLCDHQAYRLAYAENKPPDADQLQLHQLMDLTGDGWPEILAMQEFCGAHTCFQAWEILQWRSGQFANIITGRSDDLPSPELQITGPREDGSMVIMITGRGIPSAGAGPARAITRIWHWSPEQGSFIVVEDRLAPPTFRIHALHDADQAALLGDVETAASGYQRVIEDPTLDDYPYGEEGHTRLSAYALFRSVLLSIQVGDIEQAQQTWTFLREAHPTGSPGGGYSALADEVWEAYQVDGDLGRACQIAQAYASEQPALILDPLNYGYANPVYTAADICPYTG